MPEYQQLNDFSLTKQFEGTANQINQAIPRLKLGGGDKPPNPTPNQGGYEDPLIKKLKRWLLIILTSLVGGIAGILLLMKIIRMVF